MKTRLSVPRAFVGVVVLVGLIGMQLPAPFPAQAREALPGETGGAADVDAAPVGGGPIFVENVGRFDDGARFQISHGLGGDAWLADDALWLRLVESAPLPDRAEDALLPAATERQDYATRGAGRVTDVKISFLGANPRPRPVPLQRVCRLLPAGGYQPTT